MATMEPMHTTRANPRAGLRRAADVLVALVLLAICLPLMGGLALGVRLTSSGPVLRRHRVMRGGEIASLLSFRTTLDGATSTSHARVRTAVGVQELPVTRIGWLMRATRTDRLPRLLNVVRGDLSLF